MKRLYFVIGSVPESRMEDVDETLEYSLGIKKL